MKQTLKAFLHYDATAWPKPRFALFPFDMSSAGHVLVNEIDVEVDIPDDFDPTAAQVDALRKEREQVAAEFGRKLMEIDASISKLLSIEHTPADEVIA